MSMDRAALIDLMDSPKPTDRFEAFRLYVMGQEHDPSLWCELVSRWELHRRKASTTRDPARAAP